MLRDHPLSHDDLVAAACERLSADAAAIDQRIDHLIQRDTVFSEVGDELAHVPNLLDGTSWVVQDGARRRVRMEEHWLDEQIPALGGRTPRDAVRDPVGREEVEQLLASIPPPTADNPVVMDAGRIRRALGL